MSGRVRLVCRQSWDQPWFGAAIGEPAPWGGLACWGRDGLDEQDGCARVLLVQPTVVPQVKDQLRLCPDPSVIRAVQRHDGLCERRVGTHGEKVTLSPPLAQPAV